MIKSQKKKLILGTAKFGYNYGISKKILKTNEIKKIFKIVKSNKINFVDTAQNYVNSERRLGILKNCNPNFITKINLDNNIKKNPTKYLENKVLLSLKKLRIKRLYGLLIHNPSFIFKNKKFYKLIYSFKKKGLVKKIGFSIYNQNELKIILDKFKFDLIQLPISLFDRRFVANNSLKILKKRKVEIHARSIFLQGLLINEEFQKKKFFQKWKNDFKDLSIWSKKNHSTVLASCISYVFSVKEIDKIVIGVDSAENLKEIISSNIIKFKQYPKFEIRGENKLLNPSNWR